MFMSPGEHRITLEGPVGPLEARLMVPKDRRENRIAIVCHPLSTHGGSMNNKVVTTVVRALSESGVATLRFNFRSVGDSAGVFDCGQGEGEDLLAAWDWLQAQYPQAECILAGFSFGSYVSYRMVAQIQPKCLITIAPPVERYDYSDYPSCPWIVIQSDDDEVVVAEGVYAWVAQAPKPPTLIRFEASGHFFHGQLIQLRERLKAALIAQH